MDNAAAKLMVRPGAQRLTSKEVEQLTLRRGDTAFDHYPEQAKRDAVDGSVLVDILLNVEGQVLEAEIIAEAPRGFGFGIAALDTAKTLEFSNPFRRQVLFTRDFIFLP